ncbi:MAG: hypothetical protein HYV02_03890 [Deltaproteobacteria bacterium]|nr:hypothetical protein [Deltaproteobacteria bacterium]
MARDPRDPIAPIDRQTSRQTPVEQTIPKGRALRPEVKAQAPHSPPVPHADQFRPTGALDRFLAAIAKRVEQGVGFYHVIRLPGRGRVVQDRRGGEPEPQGGAARESLPLREEHAQGRAAPSRPHFFHDRHTVVPQQHRAQSPGGDERPDSKFEQEVVARFEKGKTLEQAPPNGRAHFLVKSAVEWMQFFRRFLHRTVLREISIEQLADEMLFRGLLQQKGKAGKGVLVGDLILKNGAVEKFARVDVDLTRLMARMQGLEPGTTLTRQLVVETIQAEILRYFAIGPAKGEATRFVGAQASAGIFTTRRTEEAVARRLGIRLDGGTAKGPEERGENTPEERFVPWWRWDREERGGLRRWFVPVTLGTLVVIGMVTVWVLLRGA